MLRPAPEILEQTAVNGAMNQHDARRAPVALITGGRRGLGRGIAWAMAESGFDILLADLERDASADETLAGIVGRGRRAEFAVADIAELEGHAALIERAYSSFGALDCLVNNAGVTVDRRGDLLDATVASYDRVMNVNLRGTFFLTQAVARRMLAETRPADAPHRSLVVISSINAVLPSPDRPEYAFSKTALSMMAKMFALRLAAAGIAVYEIRPGIMRTDMTAPVAEKYERWIADGVVPQKRWGEAEDVGRTVAALASGTLPFTTGEPFHVDGGLHIQKL
jgi:NAD(P)-dependent dehydrogenase (short-subunit alcohol dehydrogenase family)